MLQKWGNSPGKLSNDVTEYLYKKKQLYFKICYDKNAALHNQTVHVSD